MGARSKNLTSLFCGSTDWRDNQIILTCLWGLYEIVDNREEGLVVVHTNDAGVGRITKNCIKIVRSVNQGVLRSRDLEGKEYIIDPEDFTPAMGYIRNEKMISETNPDIIFAFAPDISSSPGTQHMLELAAASGVTSYLIQRYS